MVAVPTASLILLVYPAYVFLMNAVVVIAKYMGTKKAA
jgi:hypothetical protein